jgi:hypothetical protein
MFPLSTALEELKTGDMDEQTLSASRQGLTLAIDVKSRRVPRIYKKREIRKETEPWKA